MAEYSVRMLIARAIKEKLIDCLDTDVADLKVRSVEVTDAIKFNPDKLGGLHAYITLMDQEMDITKKKDDGRVTIRPHLIDGGLRTGFMEKHAKVTLFMVIKIKSEELAREQAEIIFARAQYGLRKMDIPLHPDTNQPEDDFGEGVTEKEMAPAKFSQEGSSQGTHTFKAEFLLKFFTFVGG
jgi:hypothetical protein